MAGSRRFAAFSFFVASTALTVFAWAFWPQPPDFDPAPLLAAARQYDARIARSPHYADQLPLFAQEQTKRVPLTEAELLAAGAQTVHPGEARPR